jgi:hypothetical protein
VLLQGFIADGFIFENEMFLRETNVTASWHLLLFGLLV